MQVCPAVSRQRHRRLTDPKEDIVLNTQILLQLRDGLSVDLTSSDARVRAGCGPLAAS